jgi:hypothetical protein
MIRVEFLSPNKGLRTDKDEVIDEMKKILVVPSVQ